MKRIKIVRINDNIKDCELKLEQLVNEGWIIICGGGGSGQYTFEGFVVLQK